MIRVTVPEHAKPTVAPPLVHVPEGKVDTLGTWPVDRHDMSETKPITDRMVEDLEAAIDAGHHPEHVGGRELMEAGWTPRQALDFGHLATSQLRAARSVRGQGKRRRG